MCSVCRVIVAPTVRGHVRAHSPGRRKVIDRTKPKCPGGGSPSTAPERGVPQRVLDAERRREFRQLVEDSSIGPDALRAELTTSPVRCYDRTCRHHHAEGDPFDRSLITGPPCEGCRWCQAIAVRSK